VELTLDPEALRAAGVELLVLFGSAARGATRPSSDLDLGVLFRPSRADREAGMETVARAVRGGREVDLVDLEEADPLLLREVAEDGRPVFEARPRVFEEFRVRAVKRYFDTAWIRRIEERVLRERHG
jgi:predicted nucleotidyltransferase